MATRSAAPALKALATYRKKRNFKVTTEPSGDEEPGETGEQRQFVIQKHWASRLHYDFRLEIGGTMKSWAVPKGPSLDPADKHMAVQVEDHPMAYNAFEGQIPAGQYGAGKVIVWDRGTWTPVGDAAKAYKAGKLKFTMDGHKLHGGYTLVRMHGRGDEKQPPWLLIKERDEFAREAAEFSVVDEMPESVKKAPVRQRAPAGRAEAAALRHALPATFAPQLATLVEAPPANPADWIFELKFDGYRMLARIEGANIKLFTRNGNDWTRKLPALAAALKSLKLKSGWLDGEIIVPGAHGAPDFQALQNAFDDAATRDVVYYLFDLPFHDGRDLRQLPTTQRREILGALLKKANHDMLRFSEAFDAKPADLVASACKIGFEGVIGKRKDGAYVSRRSPDWIKLKCSQRQEFVIGGYTDPKGARTGIGSLLLGVHDKAGKLQYVGNVGTGFSERTLVEVTRQLKALDTATAPFENTGDIPRKSHWVKPHLLAEVSFAEWTNSNHIRHSVFHGLRLDKPASAIVHEKPAKAKGATLKKPLPAALRVTHPKRVIDKSSGITKLDLVNYYASVWPVIAEHLKARPVALLRAPEGVEGQAFFQKHEEGRGLAGLCQLDAKLDPGHAPLLEIDTLEGLLSAAQMNVVELHTWNAKKDRIEKPDRMTFDLDPGEGVVWAQVQEGAQLVKVLLDELGFTSFLKTSGGKGLHVVVPIKRLHGWDTVKDFSQAVVAHLVRTIPQRFVVKSGPRNRVGKIFVDYLRNGRGATTACAWAARARPGMGVSVPLAWDELPDLTSGAHWTVQSLDAKRIKLGNTPWNGYDKAAKSIAAGIKTLGRP